MCLAFKPLLWRAWWRRCFPARPAGGTGTALAGTANVRSGLKQSGRAAMPRLSWRAWPVRPRCGAASRPSSRRWLRKPGCAKSSVRSCMWPALIVSGLLMSGCACKPSTTPTSLLMPPPAACLADCAVPPAPSGERMQWEEQMLDWAFDCRRKANECSAWVRDQVAPLK